MEIMKGELTYEHQISKNKNFKSTYQHIMKIMGEDLT